MEKRNYSLFFYLINIILFLYISCSPETGKNDIPDNTVKKTDTIQKEKKLLVKDGEEVTRYKSGVIKMKGSYLNGKKEGQWNSWYENGNSWSEVYYKNGRREGKVTVWYENGKKRYEGFFTNDLKSNTWNYWDESGKLIKTEMVK